MPQTTTCVACRRELKERDASRHRWIHDTRVGHLCKPCYGKELKETKGYSENTDALMPN